MTATDRAHFSAGISPEALAASRAFCKDVTRRQAKNFYWGLKLLPEPKRSAMYALYAYMRLVDDIADDESAGRTPAQRRADLDAWTELTREAVAGVAGNLGGTIERRVGQKEGDGADKLWPAFVEMVRTYRIPLKVFELMIAGQRQDMEGASAMPDFAALYDYCYRVASVVGVASLYVFGFEGGEATLELGVKRGVAFQLTNILRDVREDAQRGRCYFPVDELARFGVSPANIATGHAGPGFLEMMRFNLQRAQDFYDQSAPLELKVAPDARPTLRAMTAIYHGLLEKIAADPVRVLHGRVRLSAWRKLTIAWRARRRESR